MPGWRRSGGSGPNISTRSNATSTVQEGANSEHPLVDPADCARLLLSVGRGVQGLQGRNPRRSLPRAAAQRLARARRDRDRERRADADRVRRGGARGREPGARRGVRAEIGQAGRGQSVRVVRPPGTVRGCCRVRAVGLASRYTPGPAGGARVEKDGDKWTLVLVRELRHARENVWQALTDPAQLREWAPFDADGSLGTVGTRVKLTTVGAPTPHITETTVTRADAPKLLEYNWGGFDMRWQLEAVGGGTRLTLWTNIEADVPPGGTHRDVAAIDGCRRVAH